MRTDPMSVYNKARLTGALWLAVIVTGAFATLMARAIYVPGDPAATAASLLAAETQFRFAFVTNIVSFACYAAVTGLLYVLLKPVSQTLALIAMIFGVTGTAIGMSTSVAELVPLLLLKGSYLVGFSREQLSSLALTSFSTSRQGVLVSWVFFGLQCFTAGFLIACSSFLPRILGILLSLGGSAYVLGCLSILLWPGAGGSLFPVLAATALLGEGALSVWFVVKGLNVERWILTNQEKLIY